MHSKNSPGTDPMTSPAAAPETQMQGKETRNEYSDLLSALADHSGKHISGLYDDQAWDAIRSLQSRLQKAEFENKRWRVASVTELGGQNQNLLDYMTHWEDRAIKAETSLASLRQEVGRLEGERDGAEAEIERVKSYAKGEIAGYVAKLNAAEARVRELEGILKLQQEINAHQDDRIRILELNQ